MAGKMGFGSVYGLLFGVIMITLAVVALRMINQAPASGDAVVPDGRTLFAGLGCASCHQVVGQGGNIGPPLGLETAAHGLDWLHDYLTSGQHLDVYPGMGHGDFERLTTPQARELAGYLASLSVSAEYRGPGGRR